jgi:hypothetical protein
MLDWLNRLRNFKFLKFPPVEFFMLVGWSMCHVLLLCSWNDALLWLSWRQVGLQKQSFVRSVGTVVYKLVECK